MDAETEKDIVQDLRTMERAMLREFERMRAEHIKIYREILDLKHRIDHIHDNIHQLDCY